MQTTDSSLDPAFLDHLLDQLVAALPGDASACEARRAAARLALLAANPADAMAALLAVQAIAAHYAVMDAFARAAQAEDDKAAGTPGGEAASARASQARARRTSAPVAQAAAAVDEPVAVVRQPEPALPPIKPHRRWETMTMEERRAE